MDVLAKSEVHTVRDAACGEVYKADSVNFAFLPEFRFSLMGL